MRCHIAHAEDRIGTNAFPQILEQLKENGELILPALVIFTSDNANFGWYSRMLSNSFPNATVIGSTSNAFLSPESIAKEGIVVMAVTSGIKVASGVLFSVSRYPARSSDSIRQAYEQIEKENTVCLEFNASPIGCEEIIMDTFREVLGEDAMPLCGCTAVDALDPDRPAAVSLNGIQYMDACVFVMIHNMNGRIALVSENIFRPTGHFLMTTDVDCDERKVYEFDHKNAAEAVASAMKIHTDELDANLFSHPLGRRVGDDMVNIGGREVFADGSISFFSKVYKQTRVALMEPDKFPERIWEETSEKVFAIVPKPSFAFIINCRSRIRYFNETGRVDAYRRQLSRSYPEFIAVSGHGEQMNYGHYSQIMVILAFE